ncbi:sensor histidine kinase [Frateuria sp. STR12]|uniref:sensor histidine kinase n=1 Tax=Frateuria hangzhouensis TaxID=2995589 RepID=UPI002260F08A|nr:PAS domain-containing sensor histidine kinase [Frateuria sp. STR12]MCX7514715.1 PAS domain-containing protein [Frateuria sp. STR12]
MSRAVREFDWASTPLGPIEQWPLELRTAAGLVLESGFPKALMWGPSLTTLYNDAFRPILGVKPEALGRSFRDIWAEAWDVLGPIAERALEGRPTFIENFEVQLDRFGQLESGWFTFSYHPVRLADGSVGGVMDTVVETTATIRAQRETQILRDELGHRLKNTLAMVQSIAARTFNDSRGMEAFQARIRALADAHDVLLQQQWIAAPMRRVIDALLAVHGGRFELSGPDLSLGPRTTVALSLILHELATNAVKYGALSVPQGRVSLRWHVDAGDLQIQWRESGGPAVTTPARPGFGSRLIDMGLSGSGRVERRYPASGVEVDLYVARPDLAL